jgi:hypothetical protein
MYIIDINWQLSSLFLPKVQVAMMVSLRIPMLGTQLSTKHPAVNKEQGSPVTAEQALQNCPSTPCLEEISLQTQLLKD